MHSLRGARCRGVGAVASRRAAELYELEILEEGIQVSGGLDLGGEV